MNITLKRPIRRHLILLKHYKQRIKDSCGIACLRMLFERFGKEYSERFLMGLGDFKEGMDEDDIQLASEKLGFECKIYNRMFFTDLINKLDKNIPILVGFKDHWQIVVGYDSKYILIVDPNYKKIKRINRERFLKLWQTEYNQALEIT